MDGMWDVRERRFRDSTTVRTQVARREFRRLKEEALGVAG